MITRGWFANRPHCENVARTQQNAGIVYGHTPQASGLPLDLGHAAFLDTPACGGGWLTCLETESGMYRQANRDGQLRSGR
jgi:hypothetical protein